MLEMRNVCKFIKMPNTEKIYSFFFVLGCSLKILEVFVHNLRVVLENLAIFNFWR